MCLERSDTRRGESIISSAADAAGKEELEPAILNDAIVVVDDIRQASSGGEINVPVQKGLYSVDKVYGTLAELVLGRKNGRSSNEDITVFDSTGIAIEDIAVARLLFEKARETGVFSYIDLIGI